MKNLINKIGKNKISRYAFKRQEILDSISNNLIFSIVNIFISICRISLTLISHSESSTQKMETVSFMTLNIAFSFSSSYYMLKKIRPNINKSSNEIENISFYTIMVQISGLIFIGLSPCGILISVIRIIEDEFLRGVSLPIVCNLLTFTCHFFLRNNILNFIIYAIFTSLCYLCINPLDHFNKELLVKLIVANTISFATLYQINAEKKNRSKQFIKRIFDYNNIFKKFLKRITDLILLRSLGEDFLIFKNKTFTIWNVTLEEFTIDGEAIYNSEEKSLKEAIDILTQKSLAGKKNITIYEGDFHSKNSTKMKMYSVFSLKIKYHKKEYLGLYIKEITKTANLIAQITSEKVANNQICSISHELRTPINQAFGIVNTIKSQTKDLKMKNELGMIKSSISKLLLKVEEYIDWGKIINSSYQVIREFVNISMIFKEIKRLNYENVKKLCPPKITFKFNPLITKTMILLPMKIVLILIQFILKQINQKFSVTEIEIFSILTSNNFEIQFLLTYSGSNSSNSGLLVFNSKKGLKNIFEKSDLVEKISDTSKNFIQTISGISNFKIDSIVISNTKYMYTLRMDDVQLIKERKGSSGNISNVSEFNLSTEKCHNAFEINHPLKTKTKAEILNKFACKNNLEVPIIFVIDDNSMNRYAVCGMLKDYQVKIIEGENGIDCLKRYYEISKENKNRLIILMDLDMPKMDGIECTIEIRKIEKECKIEKIPIIALTAHETEIEKAKALRAGMNDFYSKPLKREKLKEILLKYLNI